VYRRERRISRISDTQIARAPGDSGLRGAATGFAAAIGVATQRGITAGEYELHSLAAWDSDLRRSFTTESQGRREYRIKSPLEPLTKLWFLPVVHGTSTGVLASTIGW